MTVILENARVFDGVNDSLLENAAVVVEGGRIVEVSDVLVTCSAALRMDCGGRVLMPGLIDAHIHAYSPTFNFFDNDHMPPALLASHAAKILEGMLRRGFTTVRDAAGADRGLWMAIEQGLIRGPRLFFSGKAISQTGGHGDMRPVDHYEICGCGGYSGSISVVVDGEVAVRQAVRNELRKGAHQIKIFASGGVCSPSDPLWMNQFTEEEIRAAVYEAGNHRSYVMAHCHTDEAARRCIALGVRSIEHGSDIQPDTAKRAAKAGAFVVPTLAVTEVLRKHGPSLGLPSMSLEKIGTLYDRILKAIETCARAGVKIGLGADLLDTRFHPLQGLELKLRGEVSAPLDVLRSATSINAELLRMEGELGCIRVGALADIIVLNFDPLADLAPFEEAERNIVMVMKGGVIVRSDLGARA